jgi:hypothetical protein
VGFDILDAESTVCATLCISQVLRIRFLLGIDKVNISLYPVTYSERANKLSYYKFVGEVPATLHAKENSGGNVHVHVHVHKGGTLLG